MSTDASNADAVAALQLQIQRRLETVLQRNAEGGDVAPGERLRLEGWMEAALLLAGDSAARCIAGWQAQLSARAQLRCEVVDGYWCVRFDIWQSRAPVTPSTRD